MRFSDPATCRVENVLITPGLASLLNNAGNVRDGASVSPGSGDVGVSWDHVGSDQFWHSRIKITNGYSGRLEKIDLKLPTIFFPNPDNNLAIQTSSGGGKVLPWNVSKSESFLDGRWPGQIYSPIVTFFNKSNQWGAGITFWSEQLKSMALRWTTGMQDNNAVTHPVLSIFADLERGETAEFIVEYQLGHGMPHSHWTAYRNRFLVPFMRKMKIFEESYRPEGPWGMSFDPTFPLSTMVKEMAQKGIKGYIQFPTKLMMDINNIIPVSPPHPFSENWGSGFQSEISSLAGIVETLGASICPFVSGQWSKPDMFYPTGRSAQNLISPTTTEYFSKLIAALKKCGVTVAYAEHLGDPWSHRISGIKPLIFLKEFLTQGIRLFAGGGGDLAAFVTGAALHQTYTGNNFELANVITPNSTQFLVDWQQSTQKMMAVPNCIPILTAAQLA